MTEIEVIARCKNCIWSGPQRNFDEYECRRNAPVAKQVDSCSDIREVIPIWPVMRGSHEWCGQFEKAHRE